MRSIFSIIFTLLNVCAFAQQVEIRESFTNDFIPSKSVAERRYWIDDNAVGVQSMYSGEYCDSLVRYFDSIEEYHPQVADTISHRYYRAIFGVGTLCYKERREVFYSTFAGKRVIEVESIVAPHQRFVAEIEGLSEEEIEVLKHKMQQMQSSELLMNNAQTCIFYALNLMFDYHKIDPSPIITRNTNLTDGHQLNAFFKHIFTLEASVPCKYSVLRKTDFPDNCVLVFRNQHNEFIHAAFYQKNPNRFYTKNGLFAPVIVGDIRDITDRYSRYDTKQRLSEEGLSKLADTVLVFTLANN